MAPRAGAVCGFLPEPWKVKALEQQLPGESVCPQAYSPLISSRLLCLNSASGFLPIAPELCIQIPHQALCSLEDRGLPLWFCLQGAYGCHLASYPPSSPLSQGLCTLHFPLPGMLFPGSTHSKLPSCNSVLCSDRPPSLTSSQIAPTRHFTC